jgi:hypothetical protein
MAHPCGIYLFVAQNGFDGCGMIAASLRACSSYMLCRSDHRNDCAPPVVSRTAVVMIAADDRSVIMQSSSDSSRD